MSSRTDNQFRPRIHLDSIQTQQRRPHALNVSHNLVRHLHFWHKTLRRLHAIVPGKHRHREYRLHWGTVIARLPIDPLEAHISPNHHQASTWENILADRLQPVWQALRPVSYTHLTL